MTIPSRRTILTGAALAAATGVAAQVPPAAKPPTPIRDRLLARAQENLHSIAFDGHHFSGPGWDLVVKEGQASEFVLVGEEHGTREIPIFARALFEALQPVGFDTLGIEISPPLAEDLDRAALGGMVGIEAFCAASRPGPAFYFWRTEAELVAAVRASTPKSHQALWGVDYEVTGDRRLIARLQAKAPPSARAALTVLDQASQAAWTTWRASHNPGALFTFAGDPALVRAVRTAWPHPDADAQRILTTLEETLEINHQFNSTQGWASNERRAALMRRNFIDHLNRAAAEGRKPKVLFKMGETHLMRGVSTVGDFDLGSLIHEAAALRGGQAFSIIAGGGKGSRHGVLNPTNMTTGPAPVDMLESFMGLDFLISTLSAPGPVLVDLRPLRALVASPTRQAELANTEAVRAIFAYDTLLVWNGATPAEMLAGGGA